MIWSSLGLANSVFFFFFQAEDGIRDWSVTGVQTCALPISGVHDVGIVGPRRDPAALAAADLVPILLTDRPAIGPARDAHRAVVLLRAADQIGRASCRERV